MQGRLKFVGFIVSAVLSAIAPGSNAQEYPVKPVKIVVTLSPGSTSDILARVLGNQLAKQLGQSFVIENRPGAGGMLAAEAVAKAPADGYTLLGNSIATHGIGPSLYPKLSFDPMRDFAPVALVASSPNVLIVGTGVAARTVPELIALIRAAPERFTFSSGGNGTSHHMAGELFGTLIGVRGVHIPYKGTPEAVNAVVTGDVLLMFPNAPNAVGLAKGGKLRALAVATPRPVSWWPELPTVAEAGVAGFDVTAWFGFAAPAGTPEAILRRLNSELNKAILVPSVREALVNQGFEILPAGTPEAFGEFMRAEKEKWARVIRSSGAKVE